MNRRLASLFKIVSRVCQSIGRGVRYPDRPRTGKPSRRKNASCDPDGRRRYIYPLW